MQEGLNLLYWIVLSLCCMLSLLCFRKLDKPGKAIAILVVISFIVELLANAAKQSLGNNLFIYNQFSVIEFVILSVYFNYTIDILKKKSIGILLGVMGGVIGFVGIYLKLYAFYNFQFVETIVMIFLSFLFYFRLLIKNNGENVIRNPHFGFVSAILFFYLVNFLNWGMYDFLTTEFKEMIPLIHNTLLITNIIPYLIFTTVFMVYFKARKVYLSQ